MFQSCSVRNTCDFFCRSSIVTVLTDHVITFYLCGFCYRRGISTFYNGKSKSFTSLADATHSTTSSIQEIAKPENAYTRKRRNYGAFKLSNMNTGGISKKPKTTMLRLTLERNNPNFIKHGIQSQINKPLALRSFSMVNLHQCNPTKIGNC